MRFEAFLVLGRDCWELVPCATVQNSSRCRLASTTPLFEKEGNARRHTIVANASDPIRINRPRVRPRLASNDHPIDVLQSQIVDRAEKRFNRKESHCSRDTRQMGDSIRVIFALHAHSHPDIRRPCELTGDSCQSFGSFRQDLKDMPMSCRHNFEDPSQVGKRHFVMEQVAHGIHENQSGLLPCQWLIDYIWLKSKLESIAIARLSHRLQSFGHSFRVAMLATGTYLRATRYGVPSSVSPLD